MELAKTVIIEPYELPELEYRDLKVRGISRESCEKYGVGVDEQGRLFAPYYVNGQVAGAKVRMPTKTKTFFWEGASENKEAITFFGLNCCFSKYNLIITEGELDAVAAYEMVQRAGKGGSYSVVSVPFGAASAKKYISRALRLVESYQKVYICFDMDAPGREASNEVMELIAPGKAYEVMLPVGCKDACDMAKAGRHDDFLKALYAAQARTPMGFILPGDMAERALAWYFDRSKRFGESSGWQGLDDLIGGYKPGEVYGIVAGTGVGKSTLVRNMLWNTHKNKVKSLLVSLEDMPETAAIHLASMEMGQAIMQDEAFTDHDKLHTAIVSVLENVTLYDHTGSLDIASLCEGIEYAVRTNEARLVVLDNLSVLAEGTSDSVLETIQRAMAEFRLLARRLGITMIVVCHMNQAETKKDEDEPHLRRIKGSTSIKQGCDCILGVKRERHSNITTLMTLKGNRTWGGAYGSIQLEYDRATGRLNELGTEFAEDGTELEDWFNEQNETTTTEAQESSASTETGNQPEVPVRGGSHDESHGTGAGLRSPDVSSDNRDTDKTRPRSSKSRNKAATRGGTEGTTGVHDQPGHTKMAGTDKAVSASTVVHPVSEHLEDGEENQPAMGTRQRGARRSSGKQPFWNRPANTG